MGKSTDFESSSSQGVKYENASSGPHIDITDYPFTLCAWVKFETVQSSTILGIADDSVDNSYHLIICSGTKFATDSRNTTDYIGAGTTTPVAGVWYHVAGVFASATDRKLYVNGVLEDTDTNSSTISSGRNTSFAGFLNRLTVTSYFDGLIAHAQIYDTNLSAAQIANVMDDPSKGPSGNLVWWLPLTDSGDIGNDLSSGAYDASLVNTPTISTDGPPIVASAPDTFNSVKRGKSTDFDSADYVFRDGSGPYDDVTAYPFTLACWCTVDVPATTQTILGLSTTDNNVDYYLITTRSGVFTSDARDNYGAGTTSVIADRWYHVAVAFESSTSRKLYVNGALENTATASVTKESNNRACVSALIINAGTVSNHAGKVAHAQVYDTGLSQAQVQSIMNDPSSGPSANLVWWLPLTDGNDIGVDLSSNSYDASLVSTPTIATEGPGFKSSASSHFHASSSDYLEITDTVGITDYPLTYTAWVKELVPGAGEFIIDHVASASSDVYQAMDFQPGPTLDATSRNATSPILASSSTTPSNDSWTYCTAVFASSTSRSAFVNAAGKVTNTTSSTFGTHNTVAIGRLGRSSPTGYLDGPLVYVKAHDISFTDNQVKEGMFNPFGVVTGLQLMPNMQNGSNLAASDFNDLSGNGRDMTTATLPNVSNQGPPVHLFPGGM